jgi:hypothetical protein
MLGHNRLHSLKALKQISTNILPPSYSHSNRGAHDLAHPHAATWHHHMLAWRPRPAKRRGGSTPLLLPLLLLLLLVSVVKATVREVELNVTHGFRALDGVERLVILGAYVHEQRSAFTLVGRSIKLP